MRRNPGAEVEACASLAWLRRAAAATLLAFAAALIHPAASRAVDSTAALPHTVIAAGQVLHGRFVLRRHLAGFAKDLQSTGDFTLAPEKGLLWAVHAPFASTTAITPNGIVQFAGGQEAMRIPASGQPGMAQLYAVLNAAVTGNIAPLKKIFLVRQSGAPAHWTVVLTPLHPQTQNLSQLTLGGGKFVDAITIDKGKGDIDRITLRDQALAPENLSARDRSLLEKLHK